MRFRSFTRPRARSFFLFASSFPHFSRSAIATNSCYARRRSARANSAAARNKYLRFSPPPRLGVSVEARRPTTLRFTEQLRHPQKLTKKMLQLTRDQGTRGRKNGKNERTVIPANQTNLLCTSTRVCAAQSAARKSCVPTTPPKFPLPAGRGCVISPPLS